MQNLRKRLQTADESFLDFQFDVVHATGKKMMLASVYEQDRKRTFFHMQKKEQHWRIVNAPKVADRFLQLEKMPGIVMKGIELAHW